MLKESRNHSQLFLFLQQFRLRKIFGALFLISQKKFGIEQERLQLHLSLLRIDSKDYQCKPELHLIKCFLR
nr:MAG TPA: hypothetical protein [Caudoviricetes sp.]